MNNWFIDKRNGFLTYETNKEDIDLMYLIYNKKFPESNILNSKTIYNKKESRLAGILGEIVFAKYVGDFGKPAEKENASFDIYVNNKKLDVKCKMRSVIPRPEFEASFFLYQKMKTYFNDVDYYAFLSTLKNFQYVWFCGYMSKDETKDNPNGVIWRAGDIDETNGKVFHEDTFSIFYKYLHQFNLSFNGNL